MLSRSKYCPACGPRTACTLNARRRHHCDRSHAQRSLRCHPARLCILSAVHSSRRGCTTRSTVPSASRPHSRPWWWRSAGRALPSARVGIERSTVAYLSAHPGLALTQDLSGETSRLLDDIWDCQCFLISRAPIGDAMCVEKICSSRCLDRKIYVLRHVTDRCEQLAYNDTNQISACVKNRPAAVSRLYGGGDLDPMTIVAHASQSGYDSGGHISSR